MSIRIPSRLWSRVANGNKSWNRTHLWTSGLQWKIKWQHRSFWWGLAFSCFEDGKCKIYCQWHRHCSRYDIASRITSFPCQTSIPLSKPKNLYHYSATDPEWWWSRSCNPRYLWRGPLLSRNVAWINQCYNHSCCHWRFLASYSCLACPREAFSQKMLSSAVTIY